MLSPREVNALWPRGVGRFLRLARKTFGLTQKEFAEILSRQGPNRYCDSYFSKLENGASGGGLDFWLQMANWLNLKLSTVFMLLELMADEEALSEERNATVTIVLESRRTDKAK
ncbi:MAG: helix-turn-helix transcriptional regulator [Patescibacteria group bacterium]